MALKIRLARGGAKKRPYYRIVVADSRAARDGGFIERLGSFNPLLPKDNEQRLKFDSERMQYWLKQGAQPTDRVAKFLASAELIAKPAPKNNPIQGKPKAKAQERIRANAAAAEAAAAATAAAARLLLGHVDLQGAAVEHLAVHLVAGVHRRLLVRVADKPEAARAAGVAVRDDLRFDDIAERREGRAEGLIVRTP